jgi:PAB1-binding protein PBP1
MNTRKTNSGNERMQGGRSRGNQRKDHYRESGMNSFHSNNYQRQKMKNSNMMNRNDSFSKSQERFDNKDSDFPALGDSPDRRMHDRLLFVIMNMVGTKVEVTTKNGTVYEGILHGTNTESELGVCLKMAKEKTNDNSQNNSYIPNLIIMGKDLAQISINNLELNKPERMSLRDTFKTDSAISGKSGEIFERQLQKWEPEKGNYDVSLELEDGSTEKWDQFETNEKLFGITTDYDEEIYTTALDRTKSDFKKT